MDMGAAKIWRTWTKGAPELLTVSFVLCACRLFRAKRKEEMGNGRRDGQKTNLSVVPREKQLAGSAFNRKLGSSRGAPPPSGAQVSF